jgi:osmotically-inducible protein OsmY
MRRFDEERRTYEGRDDWYRDRDRDRDREQGGWWSGSRDEDRRGDRDRGRRGREESGYAGPYGGGGYPGYGREYGREQTRSGRDEDRREAGGRWSERGRDDDRGYGARERGGERDWGGGRDIGGRERGERRTYREERYAPEDDFYRGRGDSDEDRGPVWGGREYGRGSLAGGREYGRGSLGGQREYGDREYTGLGGSRGREFDEDQSGSWGMRQGQQREREGWRAAERGPHTGRGPRGYKRSDERIQEEVSDRLEDDDWLDASDIDVRSEDGVVILEGTVKNKEAKRRAEDLADSCKGVKDVMNRLRVEEEEGILERIGNALPD